MFNRMEYHGTEYVEAVFDYGAGFKGGFMEAKRRASYLYQLLNVLTPQSELAGNKVPKFSVNSAVSTICVIFVVKK